MKTYRVYAECVTDCYIDVEASSEAEALQLAEDADGAEYTTTPYGDWRITGAILQTEARA